MVACQGVSVGLILGLHTAVMQTSMLLYLSYPLPGRAELAAERREAKLSSCVKSTVRAIFSCHTSGYLLN
jgi:hypothetical protein